MSDDLAVFLRGKRPFYEEYELNTYEIMKNNCSMEISGFYECIKDWLSDLINEKMILTSYEDIPVDKEGLGNYYRTIFKLRVGKEQIQFIPRNRAPVGTTGTIKMTAKKGKVIFIRDIDGIWKQVISKSPFKVTILTKNNFRGLLKSLLS